jgi:hypothetical protein
MSKSIDKEYLLDWLNEEIENNDILDGHNARLAIKSEIEYGTFDIEQDTKLNNGWICNKHKIGYISECPTCAFEKGESIDKQCPKCKTPMSPSATYYYECKTCDIWVYVDPDSGKRLLL